MCACDRWVIDGSDSALHQALVAPPPLSSPHSFSWIRSRLRETTANPQTGWVLQRQTRKTPRRPGSRTEQTTGGTAPSKSVSVLKRASRKATFPTRIPKVSFITKRTAFHFTANQILLREGDKDSCPRCWVSEDIERSSGFLTNGHFLVAHVPEPEPTRKISPHPLNPHKEDRTSVSVKWRKRTLRKC
ncbi:uncharacterized protein LOC144613150 [Panthera onca]